TAALRLPYVPYPNGVPSVSPSSTVTSSTGTPSSDATTCATVVSWPCPCDCEPVVTTTFPVRWTRTFALSQSPAPQPSPIVPTHADGATPHISTYVEKPIPRWRPSARAACCSARNPA